MTTKYKKQWGSSLRKMPWNDNDNKSYLEEMISSTIDEWYAAKHRKQSKEEIDFINSINPIACHHCFSKDFINYGYYKTGLKRYKCKECSKTFSNLTNTIFDSHKIPLSEWIEYLLHLFEFHSIKSSARDNKNASTTGKYWLYKIFAVLKECQKDIILSGDVYLDEMFFSEMSGNLYLNDDLKLRGISKNQLCVAVATDGTKIIIIVEDNTSKPSFDSTEKSLLKHIREGSKLIHDGEKSHNILVNKLRLTTEVYKTVFTKGLDDKHNPLYPINRIHYFIRLFMKNHSSFKRDKLQDWMNLIWFILSEPENRYEKIKLFFKMAIMKPNRIKYRDVISKK